MYNNFLYFIYPFTEISCLKTIEVYFNSRNSTKKVALNNKFESMEEHLKCAHYYNLQETQHTECVIVNMGLNTHSRTLKFRK